MAKFAQGRFAMKYPDKYVGGKTPLYRSSWEFAFMRMCDSNENISKWASEAIKIPYRNPFTGKQTIYVPDFFIVYTDANSKKHVELIEVKPFNQTVQEKAKSKNNRAHYLLNQAKWSAANAYCKQNKIRFRVVTENDIFHTGRRG